MIEFENRECHTLSTKYKLNIEDANFAKGFIPRKIILDRTRNIHSYLVICKCVDDFLWSNYWEKDTFTASIKSMLAVQYSELDRPLFFIFSIENRCRIIEGNELREAILDDPKIDINQYILSNAYNLFDMIIKIKKEL
jgi:hypothetical protein